MLDSMPDANALGLYEIVYRTCDFNVFIRIAILDCDTLVTKSV